MNSLLLILGLIAALLLVVMVYYAARLVRVSRHTQDSATRLHVLLSRPTLIDTRTETLGNPGLMGEASHATLPVLPVSSPATDCSDPTVTCEGVGLRAISQDAIFLARDAKGEVQVQVGNKPPLPLKYVLDPAMRQALQQAVSRATLSFGYSWSILASESEDGGLSLRRLT